MLLYCNRSFWRVVLQRHGSIFLRTDISVCSLFLASVAGVLQYLIDSASIVAPALPHHYGMHALGVVVAFAVVFRTNLGWQRYWESVTQLHFMYSKWADAYTQMYAFAQVTIEQTEAKGGEGSTEKVGRVRAILESLERNFGILSALSADRLAHGDLQRMEKRMELSSWNEQIILRKDLRGSDITGATNLPEFLQRGRTSRNAPITQPLGAKWHMTYVVKEVPSDGEMKALQNSTDRVNMVMYWIVHGLAAISKDLDIAPPIQSRMYQELSNGMLGFSNCMKIADVPFPFPYAQLLTYILVVYAFFIPVYVVCFTDSMIAGPLLSFLLFQGIWGVNEVAKEIENPFGTDVNDISLADFHARFIDVLAEINLGSEAKLMMNEKTCRHDDAEPFKSERSTGRSEEDLRATQNFGTGRLRKLGRLLTVRGKRKRTNNASSASAVSSKSERMEHEAGSAGRHSGNSANSGTTVTTTLDVVPSEYPGLESAQNTENGPGTELPVGQERTPLQGLPFLEVNLKAGAGGFAGGDGTLRACAPDSQPPSPIQLTSAKTSSKDTQGSCLASEGFETLPPMPIVVEPSISAASMDSKLAVGDIETGIRPDKPASGGLMTVVDEHLAQIGASMERHLAQIAKELQIISGMQLQLHGVPHSAVRVSI